MPYDENATTMAWYETQPGGGLIFLGLAATAMVGAGAALFALGRASKR